jgi:hypothetical protein
MRINETPQNKKFKENAISLLKGVDNIARRRYNHYQELNKPTKKGGSDAKNNVGRQRA